MSSRNYVFTINNPDDRIFGNLKSVGKGIAFQYERGNSGTLHIQGYVEFAKNLTFRQAVKSLGGYAHIERRRGTREDAINYCTKEETGLFCQDQSLEGPFFRNLKKGQGQRTDLLAVKEDMDIGMSLKDISEKHFYKWLKYNRGFEKYKLYHADTSWRNVEVLVFWGKTGVGKTRKAWAIDPELFRLPNPGKDYSSLWFNGYFGQTTMLIDEFYGQIRWSDFLAITDGHYVPVEIKGTYSYLQVTRIIITSNSHPNTWYRYAPPHMAYETLLRRLNKIVEMI